MDHDLELDDYYSEDSVSHQLDEIYDDYESVALEDGGPIESLFNNCIVPVVFGSMGMLLPSLIVGIMYRVVVQILDPVQYEKLIHVFSAVSGVIVLGCMFGCPSAIMAIVFSHFCHALIHLAAVRRSRRVYPFGIAMLLTFMIFREYLPGGDYQSWHSVRSVYMIIIMKTLAVVYELSYSRATPAPPLFSIYGYIFFPATVLFGPFIGYDQYIRSTDRRKFPLDFLTCLLTIFEFGTTCFYLTVCLIMSTCGFEYMFSGWDSSELWMKAVEASMSIRFSHYFICMTAEALNILCGVFKTEDGEFMKIVTPSTIELPRSLVEVVVAWNAPMHGWLKSYVHTPLSHLGSGTAAILTFIVSAMLHGLNFPVTAVLLSLALYAFVEHYFRKHLAVYTNSCVGVRDCRRRCGHKNRSGKFYVVFINFVFTAIALWHLNYLGVMMHTASNSGDQEKQYESILDMWYDQLEGWRKLDFMSHQFALISLMSCITMKLLTLPAKSTRK